MNETVIFAYPQVGSRRATLAIKHVSGNTVEDSIFVLSEALCSEKDNFSKRIGKGIAAGRANKIKAGKKDVSQCKGAKLFTYPECFDEKAEQVMLTTPISEVALSPGFVKRIHNLLPITEDEIN